jgi:signal peptide peptidase SppA
MKVIGYLESSYWTMRFAEFGTMMRVAYSHADHLDSLLAEERRERPASMMAVPGQRLEGTRYVEMRGSTAVVDVNGIIAKRMDMFDEICFGGTSTEKLMKDFRTAMDDPKVESIVLNIDSPGGEAFGINELAQAIYDARGKKPIKAYVGGLGCSGAYWIASAADEVVADRAALLGSIGVVTAWTDDAEMYKMLGIRKETVVSSNAPKKRLNFDEPADRRELQRELDSIERVFHKSVARNRGVKIEQVINDFNQGGVLAGKDAVNAGMADRTGSLEEVIKELRRKPKSLAAGASVLGEGEMDMGFRDEFKSFAQRLGFKVQDDQQRPGETDEEVTINEPAQPAEAPETPAAEPQGPGSGGQQVPAKETALKMTFDIDTSDAVAKLEAFKKRAVEAEAQTFIETEIKAGRLFPSEKESATALYTALASMDDAKPLADFKAMQRARKPHGLTDEQIDAEANQVLLAGMTGTQTSEERLRHLAQLTPLGKSALTLVEGDSKTAKA